MSEVRKLLDRLLSSELKAELLAFFNKNPGYVDDREGVVRRIKQTGDSIELDLRDLVDLEIVGTKRIGEDEVFFLNQEKAKEIQELIAQYIREF